MSGQWAFVTAAYGLTALLTAAVLLQSWRGMRNAERRSDAIGKDRR